MASTNTSKNRTFEKKVAKKKLFSSSSTPWQQDILHEMLSSSVSTQDPCLDAACGVGNNIQTLLRFFGEICAFDKKKEAVALARERYEESDKKLSFSIANLNDIPYPDNTFRWVVCTEALEHVEDYTRVLQELRRVTAPNGYIILSFQNHFNLSALIKFLYELLFGENWDVWGTHRHDEGYENYITCFHVKATANKMRLQSIQEIGADYINAWLSWIPYFYQNYEVLDKYPLIFLGRLPILKYFGMDYFMLLKNHD